jgi:hypothetical protein
MLREKGKKMKKGRVIDRKRWRDRSLREIYDTYR